MQTPDLPQDIKRTINLIVLHCSATPNGRRLGTAARTAAGVIDQWHLARGFKRDPVARDAFNWRLQSIGYHYVIDLDGYIWTGRHLNEIGAHVAGHNATSVGVCLVGGLELVGRYTGRQWDSLKALVQQLRSSLGVGRIVGHRDLSPDIDGDGEVERREWLKTCPGFDASTWLMRGMRPEAAHLLEA